jgi:hypothetical protein
MKTITYTLLADGSSDKALMPIINWILNQIDGISYYAQYAEQTLKPSAGLRRRVHQALRIYECDILFIHRDAETMDVDLRIEEIRSQIADLGLPYVPIVPIRMTEAWLLCDEKAIRSAAANPNGKANLRLPHISELERLINPKQVLFDALKQASDLPARRMLKFRPEACRYRIAELIDDFVPLRSLKAFRKFESSVIEQINGL